MFSRRSETEEGHTVSRHCTTESPSYGTSKLGKRHWLELESTTLLHWQRKFGLNAQITFFFNGADLLRRYD